MEQKTKYTKLGRWLASIILALVTAVVYTIYEFIFRALSLLPTPWSTITQSIYTFALLTCVAYFLLGKLIKSKGGTFK